MTRDPNYDTKAEYEMDRDTEVRKRCHCSGLATIKTTFNRDGVAYHCSEMCKQWWLKNRRQKVQTIDKVETSKDGFAA